METLVIKESHIIQGHAILYAIVIIFIFSSSNP